MSAIRDQPRKAHSSPRSLKYGPGFNGPTELATSISLPVASLAQFHEMSRYHSFMIRLVLRFRNSRYTGLVSGHDFKSCRLSPEFGSAFRPRRNYTASSGLTDQTASKGLSARAGIICHEARTY
jgi:hypothetical protein